MTYRNYSHIDFIRDDFFIKWVKNPDKETNLFWNNWMDQNPGKRNEVEIARQFLKKVQYENFEFPEDDYNRIHERILIFNKKRYMHEQDEKRFYQKAGFKVAASLLLIVMFVGFWNFYKEEVPEEEVPVTAYVTKTTVDGSKYTLILQDGTTVKLNSGSYLRYPESFSENVREVYLEGEAFFDVVKDEKRPFIVQCRDLKTVVVGTSFNVKSYKEREKTKVALVDGKVKIELVSKPDTEYFLEPNQMVIYDRTKKEIKTEKFNFINEVGWKEGIISFSDEPLKEVFKKLERWYGVKITVAPGMSLSDIIKGDFKNELLSNVLASIGYTSDFDFEINGKYVRVYPRKTENL